MLHPDTLDVAIPLIERFEGVELDAYLCPAGVPTICAGLTRYPNGTPVRMGDVCSSGACTGYLKEMLEKRGLLLVFGRFQTLSSLALHVRQRC